MVATPPAHRCPRATQSSRLRSIHLCTGILERNGQILLAASRYPNHPEPLWNLPGGRQLPGELLPDTLAREFLEETGLHIAAGALLYVSESYDGNIQFTNTTFAVSATGEPKRGEGDAHVVELEWVDKARVVEKITVRVVREPLVAFLRGEGRRYYGYAEAGISIEFAD